MFCDLVGSTELAEQLGEEKFFELLDGFHAQTAEIVEQFGGHVAEYLGDGVLAYFGYPNALEHSAEIAARSALNLIRQSRSNQALNLPSHTAAGVRIGIHTGPVAIGRIGGTHGRPRALGLTVNMASRVQAKALRNTLLVSQATHELLGPLFETKSLGDHRLKGIAVPVGLYRVLDINPRQPAEVNRSTFVNRTTELGALTALVKGTNEGESGYLRVVGDAGVGKSRLLKEAKRQTRHYNVHWIELTATPLSRDSAFHPIVEYLAREWQTNSPQQSDPNDRIAAELEAVGISDPLAINTFADLLDVALDNSKPEPGPGPEVRRKLIMDSLLEYFALSGEQQPMILVWDDVHWLDPSSLEFIQRLARRSEHISVIALSRPFKGDIPNEVSDWPLLTLNGLRDVHAQKMIEQASDKAFSKDFINQLLQRANGIPLYIEELLNASAFGSAQAALNVPSSLKDLLMTRLEAAGDHKSVAQIAAALQQQFDVSLIAAVASQDHREANAALANLVTCGLLQQETSGPAEVFSFRHTLLRDSAYESMTVRSRLRLHSRIADVLASGNHGSPSAERLAHHQKNAERFDEAAFNLTKAADQAKDRGAFVEAQTYYQDALACFARLDSAARTHAAQQQELSCRLGLGASIAALYGWADNQTRQVYLQALETAQVISDRRGQVMCLMALAVSSGDRGEIASALEFAERIGTVGEQTKLHVFLQHAAFAHPLFFSGEVERSFEHAKQALASYTPAMDKELAELGGTYLPTMSRLYCAFGAWFLKDWSSAREWIERALAAVPQEQEPFSHCYALAIATSIAQLDDNLDEQRHWAERTSELAKQYEFDFFLGVGAVFGSFVTAITSPTDSNVAAFEQGLEMALSAERRSGMPTHLQAAARVAQAQGDLAATKVHLDRAILVAAETGQHYWDAELLRHRAELSALAGEHEQAQVQLQEALLIAERQHAAVLKRRILQQMT